jgi:histidine triad (HIT) family protein
MLTIFEKIIAGEIPANKIYEDEQTFAFLDGKPINPGHTLVISRKPYKDIYEIPQADFLAVMKTVHKLAPIIKQAVGADGINLGNNNGPAAGQEVPHYHVHIIPRFEGDGFSHWHGAEDYHEGEAGENIAKRVTENL